MANGIKFLFIDIYNYSAIIESEVLITSSMKTGIHPVLNTIKIVCSSCGNTFETLSTKQSIHVEVCSKCHPFYTGEHRFIDAKGRVDSFQKKQKFASEMKSKLSAKKNKKEQKEEKKTKTLRELLSEG